MHPNQGATRPVVSVVNELAQESALRAAVEHRATHELARDGSERVSRALSREERACGAGGSHLKGARGGGFGKIWGNREAGSYGHAEMLRNQGNKRP